MKYIINNEENDLFVRDKLEEVPNGKIVLFRYKYCLTLDYEIRMKLLKEPVRLEKLDRDENIEFNPYFELTSHNTHIPKYQVNTVNKF